MPAGFPLVDVDASTLLEALRQATETAGIGLSVTLSNAVPPRTLYLNRRAEELIGRSLEEVDRIGVWGCLAPEELPSLQERLQQAMRGDQVPPSYEATVVRPDGERIPVEISYSEIRIGDQYLVVSFLYDLRERRRALHALDESNRRFQHVVENAPDGVAILRGPRIVFLNLRAAGMLGLARAEDGYGRMITEFLHPDDAPKARERIMALLKTGQRLGDPAEYRSQSLDGRELCVEISSIPVEFDGLPAVVAFARDITERKAIQAKLVQADRLSALGVLSAGVAHEINNPLAYVLLNLEFMQRELARLDVPPAQLESLKTRVRDARHGAERVATIVRDLRTFARGDEGARGPVVLSKVVDAALSIANAELEPRARVVRRFGEVQPADASANRLEQVFLNLLLNAAQAIPEDSDPAEHEIEVTLRQEGSHVCVDVRDTGSGMSEEILSRIFDPFFTTKAAGVGTGLGLPICQSIVRALGGDIVVASKVGEGSRFTVTLPAWNGEAHPLLTPLPVLPTPPVPRGRVLIVDDEVAVGRTLALVLSAEHEVTVATSAAEALSIIQERGTANFDAVLCDLVMPGMTGMELFQAIEAQHPELSSRVLFMTGGLAPRKSSPPLSGQHPLFEKPFDLDLIRTTLRALVRERRASVPPAD